MNNPDTDRVEEVFRHIEKNYDQQITFTQISMKCCMRKYHFSRVFKKRTGRTFKEYHNRIRLEKAKKLLRNPRLRITEVCYAVGYNDISYFNRLFRRWD